MAMNSWSLVDPKKLAIRGLMALKEGDVSPEEAAAHAQSIGLLPQAPGARALENPLTMTPPSPSGPLSMTSAPNLFSGLSDISARRGAQEESSRQSTSNQKQTVSRVLTKPQEQARAEKLTAQGIYPKVTGTDENGASTYDFADTEKDPNDPVQQQEQGISRMEELLKMEAEANSKRSTLDLRPLAALADARNREMGRPTNLAESIPAPEDKTKQFMAYADEIQKRKADIQKAISENVKNLKGGTTIDQLAQVMMAKEMAGQKNPVFNPQDRLDMTAHLRTLQAIRGDKNLQQKLVQYQNLGNALSNLTNAEHITPQQFDEAQQAIRANLGIKGTSGVGERERTQLNDLGLSADRINQILSGHLKNIEEPEFEAHIKDLAGLESSNIRQQFQTRLNAVSAGNDSMYARRHDLMQDLRNTISANMAQLNPPTPPKKEKKQAPATPKVEKKLEDMSNDELKAYISAHGGG